jgi:large subunit ribosomal protein L6
VSRIGRLPVNVPAGVDVNIKGSEVRVKGPKGEFRRLFSPVVGISVEEGKIIIQRESDEATVRALHGTTRALIQNMVTGVSDGFIKVLEVDGVGYRAEMNGANLVLYVGYSHPVVVEPPQGISFDVDTRTRQVKVNGFRSRNCWPGSVGYP